MRFLIVVGLLLAVVAGEYDNCGRPDAVYASWDQVTLRAHRHAPPRSSSPSPLCATATRAVCSLSTMPRGQGHGTSYAYGGIESGANIFIIGRACASPSHA